MSSELLNLLPGGRWYFITVWQALAACLKCSFLVLCPFDFFLFVSSFAFGALQFKQDVEFGMRKRPRETILSFLMLLLIVHLCS